MIDFVLSAWLEKGEVLTEWLMKSLEMNIAVSDI